MTLETEGFLGPYVIECDECHDTEETDCFNFMGALNKMKSLGWRPRFNESTESWDHLCPDCKDQ